MTLNEWRTGQGLTVAELAQRIETAPTSASRYCRHAQIPRRAEMIRIYRLTHGRVEPNSFYDLPPIKRRPAGAP